MGRINNQVILTHYLLCFVYRFDAAFNHTNTCTCIYTITLTYYRQDTSPTQYNSLLLHLIGFRNLTFSLLLSVQKNHSANTIYMPYPLLIDSTNEWRVHYGF